MENLFDAATPEALALRHGLELLENVGCTPVIVESGNLELINATELVKSRFSIA
jgi:hypothetical protein